MKARRKSAAEPLLGGSTWQDPGRNGERLQVTDFPSFLLTRLGALAKTKLLPLYLERAKISLPEWRVLNSIAEFSPTSYSAIVQLSTIDKAQISLTLRTLVARGWVTWEDAAANDPRQRRNARIITITPRGRAVISKVMPDARRAQMRMLDRLSPVERGRLLVLLRKTVGILENFDDPAPD